jgi:cell wall assembly regulator SMI1
LAEVLLKLDQWLAANRPDYYAMLPPGVTEAELDDFEREFSLRLPEAYRLLYRWRNGQAQDCTDTLVQNFMFASLADVRESKQLLDGMIGFDFEDPRWWRRSWVPFLANGSGDHLCVNLEAQDGGTPGQVRVFYHDSERRPLRAMSLEAWLEELVDAMEKGRYVFEERSA